MQPHPFIALREYRDRMGDAIETIEGSAAWAEPGGIVSCAAYVQLRDEILSQLRDAMPLDGVLLGLHGAMVARGIEDCEGDLLSEVRGIVAARPSSAPPSTPIATLRAVAPMPWTWRLPSRSSLTRTSWSAPGKLVEIVARAVRREVKPLISLFDCRMIDVFPTTEASIRAFVDRLSALERDLPHVLSISMVHGFLAGDVPEVGTKVIVVTDNAPREGHILARELGLELYSMRARRDGAAGAVRSSRSARHSVRQWPIGDRGRMGQSGRGMAGDSTVILREIVDRRIGGAAIAGIWDPIAVQFCFAAGTGARIPLRFGAKSGPGLGEPVDANVTITGLSENGFMRFGGSIARLGRCAAIRLDEDIEVVLCENRVQAYTPDIFSCVGIDPSSKSLLVVKSTNHFERLFGADRSCVVCRQRARRIRTTRARRLTRNSNAPSGRSSPVRPTSSEIATAAPPWERTWNSATPSTIRTRFYRRGWSSSRKSCVRTLRS